MAKTYTVCDASGSTSVEISMSKSSETTYNYTQVTLEGEESCEVTEKRITLTFTANKKVDTTYKIWYTYEYDEIGTVGTSIGTGIVNMPANRNFVQKDVTTFYQSACGSTTTGGLDGYDEM